MPIRTSIIVLLSLILMIGAAFAQDEQQPVRIGFTGDIFLGNWAEAFIDTFGVDYPFVETTRNPDSLRPKLRQRQLESSDVA